MDQFLKALTSQSFSKIQIYNWLAQFSKKALGAKGIICGPVKKSSAGYSLTVASGEGIPSSAISHRYVLPPLLEKALLSKSQKTNQGKQMSEWGALEPFLQGRLSQGKTAFGHADSFE